MVHGNLEWKIPSVHDLPSPKNSSEKLNTYCLVTIGGDEVARSKLKAGSDPSYGLKIHSVLNNVQLVNISIRTKDDEEVAQSIMDLRNIHSCSKFKLWFDLTPKGRIQIEGVLTLAWPTGVEYTDEQCIDMMHHGALMSKLANDSDIHDRMVYLTPDCGDIRWHNPKDTFKSVLDQSRRIRVDTIKELRPGASSRRFHKIKDTKILAFTIIAGPKYENFDFIAKSQMDYDIFTRGITKLVRDYTMQGGSSNSHLIRRQVLSESWQLADKNGDNQLSLHEIFRVLKKLNCKRKESVVVELLESLFGPSKKVMLTFQQFCTFYEKLALREECQVIFSGINGGEHLLSESQFVSFMSSSQQEDPDYSKDVFSKYSTDGSLNFEGFMNYLLGRDGDIVNPKHLTQYQDMTQPFTHYFIASSHNTYLLKDQLKGPSSVEAYIRALQEGCRCVEIDCWDGPDNDPIVFHGHTLTSKIRFSDVISAINKYAFVASNYPLILSIENHCCLEQQDVLADIMTSTFGDVLLTGEPDTEADFMPSPEALRGKIIVKGKSSKKYLKSLETDNADPVSSEDSDEESEEQKSVKKDSKVAKVVVTEKLSKTVMYCSTAKFKGFDNFDKNKQHHWEMSSFVESKMEKLSKEYAAEWTQHCKRQLARIYPAGSRVNSSNYNPQPAWNAGAQIVALNYQTSSTPMHLNEGKFRLNGRTGFILKPDMMRNDESTFDANTTEGIDAKKFKITIISAQSIPKPGASTKGEIVDPYVKVQVFGVPNDCNSLKTKHVNDNGFDPTWDETFEFSLLVPELALFRFSVQDYDSASEDDFIGQYVVPASSIRPGLRHVHFLSKEGDPLLNATLFLKIEISDL